MRVSYRRPTPRAAAAALTTEKGRRWGAGQDYFVLAMASAFVAWVAFVACVKQDSLFLAGPSSPTRPTTDTAQICLMRGHRPEDQGINISEQ